MASPAPALIFIALLLIVSYIYIRAAPAIVATGTTTIGQTTSTTASPTTGQSSASGSSTAVGTMTSSQTTTAASSAVASSSRTTTTATTTMDTGIVGISSNLGIVIPLYMSPGDYWSQIETAKMTYPSVPVIAIINPDNGPGNATQSTYVSGIQGLTAAGITVYGYVDTVEASTTIASAEAQMTDYRAWYPGITGIFLDDVPNSYNSSLGVYYTTLTDYADSLGLVTQGNPGWSVSTRFFPTMDSLMIYESYGLPNASFIQDAVRGGSGPSQFTLIASNVSLPSQGFLDSVAPYVSYVWFTDYQPDYQELPSATYLDGLMSELQSA